MPKLIGRRGQIVGALDTSSIQRSSDGKFYGLFVNTKPITHDTGKQPFTTQRRSHYNAAVVNELIKPMQDDGQSRDKVIKRAMVMPQTATTPNGRIAMHQI